MRIMPADSMRVFADLIHSQLGVQIRLRGRNICVVYGHGGQKPVIYLPNLEQAKEADISSLRGFALHEAAHVRWSRPKYQRVITDHLWKYLHNAFEDQFIERRLRKCFPGARQMLRESHEAGYAIVPAAGQGTLLGKDDKPYLGDPDYVREIIAKVGQQAIIDRMKVLGLDTSDESILNETTKRLEVCRLAWLWLYHWREGSDESMLEAYRTHPWKPILDELMQEKTRNTRHAVDKARVLLEKTGAYPILPTDARAVVDVKALREKAKELRRLFRELHRQARLMREERKQRIRQRVNESPEAQRIARLLEVFKNADDEHRRQMEPELRDAEDDAAEAAERIEREEHESSRERIRALMRESIEAKEGAKQAKESAERLAVQIREDDAPGEELIAPGVMRRVVASIVEAVRSTLTASDLPSAVAETPVPPPAAAMSARKYMPYDRSFDRVERVEGTPEAHRQYEEARRECAQVIQATTERLKRLRPPARPTVRVNADAGRLDPRKAVKVGLAVRGAPVDVSRVWKETIERPEPRFAVSLLLDCSGSMHGDKFDLARKAALCLSEVMSALHIPHEIIGHTTSDDVGPVMDALKENGETPEDYSRLVPFKGYVFKEFSAHAAPTNVFSGIDMDANLDGEGVFWALERLALRKEKTKLCIVISDGLPAAPFSKRDELERHLFTVAKHAEARSVEGLHLCALGIGEERVREFYRNAEVLREVTDLPKAVLGIVEKIMAKTAKAR